MVLYCIEFGFNALHCIELHYFVFSGIVFYCDVFVEFYCIGVCVDVGIDICVGIGFGIGIGLALGGGAFLLLY